MLLIYLPLVTPRSEYVFKLIFKTELGLEYTVTTDIAAFEDHKQEKINYSFKRISDEFFIRSSSILFENTIEKKNNLVEKKGVTAILFPNDQQCDAGFDIFGAVFYMVSRYEEYLPFTPDKHGRFTAANSLAHQNGFLQYPVVNRWINFLKEILAEKFPLLQFKSPLFKAIVTYDIDVGYAFKGKGIARSIGGLVKDISTLKFKNVVNRISTWATGKDPWDIYDDLEKTLSANRLTSIFFFLMGDHSRYDKNVRFDNLSMMDRIKKIAAITGIGLHPSYHSSDTPGKIMIEKNRLEKISNRQVSKSRQHYLRFKLPGTYNELLSAGITEDYSMGFADRPGFRAGICTPFYFYDLANERETSLQLFPVSVMEGSFLYYLKIQPAKSKQIIFDIIDEVKKANGMFISIWHNNTVSEDGNFKNWKFVHDEMIKKIAELSKN